MKRLLNILLLLCCALFAVAQSDSVIRPMSVPVLLSGNFAELRSNHFHSGLDFKTQGAIGKPIYSIFDGSIVAYPVFFVKRRGENDGICACCIKASTQNCVV